MHKGFFLALATSAMLVGSGHALAQPAPKVPPAGGEAGDDTPPAKPPDAEPPGDAPAAPGGDEPKSPDGAAPPDGPPATTPKPTGAPSATAPPATAPPSGPPGLGAGGVLWPQPRADAEALKKQKDAKKDAKKATKDNDEVYAEDWWSHARPVFELHGYFRVRAEAFHNFALGRIDQPNLSLFPLPIDNSYLPPPPNEPQGPNLCTPSETNRAGKREGGDVNARGSNPENGLFPCKNKTQAGANMRFRLVPELHISDNLRVMSQIDILDNVVLGSTPSGYAIEPSATGNQVRKRAGFTPLGAFDNTQVPPTSGVNGFKDSISVKRAWAEYLTPVGMLRFGRMPSHWGLGILANSGDGYDDDFQSTADRIMFVTGIKSLDLFFAGIWDFTNEGATSATLALPQTQAYDLGQLDDVDQYIFVVARRRDPKLQRLELAKGKVVVNGGVYVVHRRQLLANDAAVDEAQGGAVPGAANENLRGGFVRRGAKAWIPDVWLQLKYKKFRFESELATIQGEIENLRSAPGVSDFSNADGNNGWNVRQWGYAAEIEQRLVEDRLKLEFNAGFASGDPDVFEPQTGSGGLSPGFNGSQPQLGGDRTISTFRFNPGYRIDLILHRNILSRIQGVYYFRPEVMYDFIRDKRGQRFGGSVAAIWTRAHKFLQTPGHERDLGIELNIGLHYQSKDGALNDDPDKMGGFYSMLQYGVLFPLNGLGYLSEEKEDIRTAFPDNPGLRSLNNAQIFRWYLGVIF